MGLCFRWFKDYRILDTGESYLAFGFCYCDEFSVDFIDSDETSHSYYLDTYAIVTIPKGTVLYHGYPIEPTIKPENYRYQIKTTGAMMSGDFTDMTSYLEMIAEIMKQHNGEE